MPEKRPRDASEEPPPSPTPSVDTVVGSSKRQRLALEDGQVNSPGTARRFIAGGIFGLARSLGTMVMQPFRVKGGIKQRSEMRTQKSTANTSKHLPIGARSVSNESSGGTLASILAEDEKKSMSQIEESSLVTSPTITLFNQAGPSRRASTASSSKIPYPTPSSSTEYLKSSTTNTSSSASVASDSPPEVYLFSEGQLRGGRPEESREPTPLEGTESQPIDLVDSESEDGDEEHDKISVPATPLATNRLQSIPSGDTPARSIRPPPSRPDISNHTPRTKSYAWMEDARSPGSSTSSLTSERKRKKKKSGVRSNLRSSSSQDKERMKHFERRLRNTLPDDKERLERIKNAMGLVYSPARYNELQFKARLKDNQADSKLAKDLYASFLADHREKQADIFTPKPKREYSFSKLEKQAASIRKDALQHRDSPIKDIVDRFRKTELEDEEKIAKKLRPACPTTMAGEKAAIVKKHLRDQRFVRKDLKHSSLSRLDNTVWLNDEIINFYGDLLVDRQKAAQDKKAYRDIHWFNSFFYTKLSTNGYSAVRRWTKKVDIFAKDIVLIPINISNMHWTAGAINIREKRFEFYDSMAGSGSAKTVFSTLRSYLEQEHMDKKKSPIDLSDWTNVFSTSTPQQDNGSDCGVFTVQTLEALSRGKDLAKGEEWDFGAQNMPYIRKLMVYEIAQEKLEPRWPKE